MLAKILKYRPAATNACLSHACQIFKHMLSMRTLQFCRASPVKDEGIGGLDERVTAVYKGVGLIMKRFTTGKVPKAFKIIPNLQNWEEVSPPCLDRKPRIVTSILLVSDLHIVLLHCAEYADFCEPGCSGKSMTLTPKDHTVQFDLSCNSAQRLLGHSKCRWYRCWRSQSPRIGARMRSTRRPGCS